MSSKNSNNTKEQTHDLKYVGTYLPNVERRLSNHEGDVGPAHVQAGEHPVPPLHAEQPDDDPLRLLGPEVFVLARRLRRHLTCHSGDLVEEVAEELYGLVPDPPVLVEEALLELGQEQRHRRLGVGGHQPLAGHVRRVPHVLVLVGERPQDGADYLKRKATRHSTGFSISRRGVPNRPKTVKARISRQIMALLAAAIEEWDWHGIVLNLFLESK